MILAANLIGLGLIILIIWWFWVAKGSVTTLEKEAPLDIIVENGVYTPALIKSKVNRPLTLRFIRKDPSPCASVVLFNDFDISQELPIGKPQNITITPTTIGEFPFTCEMVMYQGKLIIEE